VSRLSHHTCEIAGFAEHVTEGFQPERVPKTISKYLAAHDALRTALSTAVRAVYHPTAGAAAQSPQKLSGGTDGGHCGAR
jgi:hypothetical protein